MEYEIITLSEARSQGLTHYFTGKPCKRGHMTKRLVSSNSCVACNVVNSKKYYSENNDKERALRRNRYNKNPEIQKERIKLYSQSNRGKIKLRRVLRKQSIERATPSWADLKTIQQIYHDCPQDREVDHIVPINGKTVCGLHIPCNLQYLTKSENCSKGNRIWPDMW